MDELDRMFRRLVEVVRADYPSLIDRPIEVGELYQSVLPYRHHRRALGFETNQDYELAMMRLLSGERGYLTGDPRMQERLRQELQSSNPDSALFRGFATTTVTLAADAVRRAETGDAPAATTAARASAPPPAAARADQPQSSPQSPPRAVADQPVAQRVADDRAPERPRAPGAAAAPPTTVPVSSPDAETIVFRRTPSPLSPMPPMPPVMSPPPASIASAPPPSTAPASSSSSSSSSGAAAAAEGATSRPTEPIMLRSNETITIRPSGEVESSLGRPAVAGSGSGGGGSAVAPGAAAASPPPPPSAPAVATPLPSVGPPPRPRQSFETETSSPLLGATDRDRGRAGAGSSSGGAADAARAPVLSPPLSSRPPMATPQRGANTIVASGDCRYCGGTLPDGRRITFCPHCGQNLTIQHCPACSSELELGWKFCTTCGRAVGDTASARA